MVKVFGRKGESMDEKTIREIERKKKYLKRYRKNIKLVVRLTEKLSVLNERLYAMKTPILSDMPRGGVPVTIDDLLSDKQDLEKRIKKLKSRGKKAKAEIIDFDSLDDPRYAEILEAFFIDCKNFEEIAEENCYTVRHVVRLYSEALIEIECQ